MLKEGSPNEENIIRENTYKSFQELLANSHQLPEEFSYDINKTSEHDANNLQNQGDDAIEDQLKHYIDILFEELDPVNYASRLLEILNSEKDFIDEDLYEDLINYIRYGKKRRKDKKN